MSSPGPAAGGQEQGPAQAPGRGRAARRRRDRRGRGLRGTLLPAPTGVASVDDARPPAVPAARTRAEMFDDLVLDALEHLEHRWSTELEGVEFVVEEVPPAVPPSADAWDPDEEVPLAALIPATGKGRRATPPRLLLYRRPLEARAVDRLDLADLVLDVVIHEVARMLGVTPEVIDPEGHGGDWDSDDED